MCIYYHIILHNNTAIVFIVIDIIIYYVFCVMDVLLEGGSQPTEAWVLPTPIWHCFFHSITVLSLVAYRQQLKKTIRTFQFLNTI